MRWQSKNHMKGGMKKEVVEARPDRNGFGCYNLISVFYEKVLHLQLNI